MVVEGEMENNRFPMLVEKKKEKGIKMFREGPLEMLRNPRESRNRHFPQNSRQYSPLRLTVPANLLNRAQFVSRDSISKQSQYRECA